MESMNPYQSPTADVAARPAGGFDETGPFSPKGRFGRLSYLAWSVLLYIPVWVGSMAIGFMAAANGDPTQAMAMPTAMFVLMGLYFVAMVLFTIRRLHDFNASGWWTLLFLSPAVVPLIVVRNPSPEALASSMTMVAISMVLSFVFWLVLMLRRGTEGSNNYGPERITRGWEKVLGIIGIVFMVIALIGIIAAVAIPFYTAAR